MAISAPELPAPTTSTAALLDLGWVAVLLGMELDDALVELACERRDPGIVRGAGRDDHVLGEERVLATDQLESVADLGQPVDLDPGSDREIERARIRLEVVGDLVLARI